LKYECRVWNLSWLFSGKTNKILCNAFYPKCDRVKSETVVEDAIDAEIRKLKEEFCSLVENNSVAWFYNFIPFDFAQNVSSWATKRLFSTDGSRIQWKRRFECTLVTLASCLFSFFRTLLKTSFQSQFHTSVWYHPLLSKDIAAATKFWLAWTKSRFQSYEKTFCPTKSIHVYFNDSRYKIFSLRLVYFFYKRL